MMFESLQNAMDFFKNRYIGKTTCSELYSFIEKITSKGLSYKTVSNHKIVLNLIFKYSVLNGYRSDNPIQFVSVPKNLPKKQREFPSKVDLKKINYYLSNT